MAWQKPENLMYADDPQLQTWLKEGGNYGIAAGYGLAILNADHEEIKQVVESKFPPSFTMESPGHKAPVYFFLSNLTRKMFLRTKNGECAGEILWEGFQTVGPGSIHPKGGVYKIINDAPLATIPKDQLATLLGDHLVPEKQIVQSEETARKERQDSNVDLSILQVVPLAGLRKQGDEYYGPHPVHGSETGRNFWVNPAKNVWHCFRHGTGGGPLLWLAVEEGIIDCSQAGPGALRGDLFKKTLEKAVKRGLIEGRKPTTSSIREGNVKSEEGGGRESQASALVKLVLTESLSLFHDERREPYIRIRRGEAMVTLRLRSKDAKTWLSSLLWKDRAKAPSSEALSSALNVLEAEANEGEEHKLYNRVAPGEDGSIWLDLCDEEWRAIHITTAGWEVVNHPPILFRRYSHQQPIPIPVHGGSLAPILDYANITHLGDQLLYVVATITCLIPGIPHVVMILFGPQGSGKTWALRTIRIIIDPSQLDLLSLPTRYSELVQNLDHNWCAFYDNVGSLPPWQSNVFCRAVTGGGVSKRQLYTDDDDVIYQYHRCVGLTDINIAAERGDLLQRSLLLGLDAIPKELRKTESELKAKLAQDQPKILGGILDVLVKALNLYPKIKLQSLYRMADFTLWGRAITEALGLDPQRFDEAYEANIEAQNLEAVRASPISDALVRLMESNPLGWSGTMSQLYSELEAQAKELKISTRQKAWPKKPHVLSRILNELAPSLPAVSLKVERGYREHTRLIYITTVGSVGSVGELERQADWGKGGDLRNYLGEATAATVASAGSFESFSGIQTTSPEPSAEVGGEVSVTPKTDDLSGLSDRKPSLGDLLPKLRAEWKRGTDDEFEILVTRLAGYTREEAYSFRERLLDEGLLAYDPEGWLVWVT
jgi:hypothetical protein